MNKKKRVLIVCILIYSLIIPTSTFATSGYDPNHSNEQNWLNRLLAFLIDGDVTNYKDYGSNDDKKQNDYWNGNNDSNKDYKDWFSNYHDKGKDRGKDKDRWNHGDKWNDKEDEYVESSYDIWKKWYSFGKDDHKDHWWK